MDPLSIAVIVTLVSTAAMVVRAELRRRRAKAAVEAALLDALRVAAAELGLTDPTPRADQLARHSCSGTLLGLHAELSIGGRGWHEVMVRVAGTSLPKDITIGSRPRGRGIEDFDLGVAADSGTARFDEHHALFGSRAALRTHADKIEGALLELVADHRDPSFGIVLTATELRLCPGEPSLPWIGSHSLRWPCGPDELVKLWRHAERVVRAGLDRRLFTDPSK